MARDFWDDMSNAFVVESAIDTHLQGRILGDEGPLRSMTDAGRKAHGIQLPQPAGTRVRFVANLGSVLAYANCPNPDVPGTIVAVRTAEGHATDDGLSAFVRFDDGLLQPIRAEHLRLSSDKVANGYRRRVASLGDLSKYFSASSSRDDELIHKATKDIWSFKKDGGQYVIERLFDDATGQPLKV